MTSSNSGRYEIEAARSRLMLAKKFTQSATKSANLAQEQLELAKREQEDAEAYLQQVEERVEVVNIDSDGEEDEPPKLMMMDVRRDNATNAPHLQHTILLQHLINMQQLLIPQTTAAIINHYDTVHHNSNHHHHNSNQ